MRIRRLNASDAEDMYRLRLRGLRDHPEAFGQSADEMQAEPVSRYAERLADEEGRFVLGAFDGTRLIGLTGCARERRLKTLHKATLWGMYVAAEYTGQGVGRRLVDETLRGAREMAGLRVVQLRVATGNTAAVRLYTAAGFEIWGTEKMVLRVGDTFYDEHVMGVLL